MTRIDKAREAFLVNNIEQVKETHHKTKIHQAIHHQEAHNREFTLPEIILGGQDGLVNVLGVILGVAAATSSKDLVLVAGLAATFAESISMGAVAYTSKIAEADYYQSEYEREKWEIDNVPEGEKEEVRAIYEDYGFKGKILDEIVEKITSDKEVWLKVMMEQELKLEPVDRKQAVSGGIIVGISSLAGSLIPLVSFFIFPIKAAIVASIIVSALTLFAVGFYKAKKTIGRNLIKQGVEMMLIGMISAFAGYLIGSLFEVSNF